MAIVDELAHTNVPGSKNEKRWQDIEDLLDAGIDVISTVNIQHLESLNDVVEQITGIPQRETVPDEVVRRADQVELVDMTPEALRRRMAHGNVYPPDKVGAALGNYFRVGNLTALRELAMLWLADKVDDQLDHYRADHHITGTWEARERVVVGLTGGPEGETLIRRAARIADRSKGADLFAVHITPSDGLAGANPAHLAQAAGSGGKPRRHLSSRGRRRRPRRAARSSPAASMRPSSCMGASRRGRVAQIFSRGVGVEVTARSGSIDVHMVTHEATKQSPCRALVGVDPAPPSGRVRPRCRRNAAPVDRTREPARATVVAERHPDLPDRGRRGGAGGRSVAGVGGRTARFRAAELLLHPAAVHLHHRRGRRMRSRCSVYVLIAIAVSAVVDLAARRTREAAQASANAAVLANLSGSVLRGEKALPRSWNDCAKPMRSTPSPCSSVRPRSR